MTPTSRQGPSPFLEGTCIQYAWDSTCIGALKKCPRYYNLMMIEGWKPKDSRFHLEFGIFFTNAMEAFDKYILEWGFEESLAMTVNDAMNATWNEGELECVNGHDRCDGGPVEGCPYCEPGDGTPWETNDTAKNRYTFIRAIVWYLDEHKDDPAETVIAEDGTPLVERSFTMELDWGPDNYPEGRDASGVPLVLPSKQPYLLCGHLDKVVSFLGDTFVLDHKTTKSTIGSYYFDQYEPNNQMTLYTIAGRVIFHAPVKGVIIDACQSAVSFSRFERGLTYRTQAQLDEWLKDLHYWFEQAERYATEEYWPMNDVSCFNCDFNRHGKKICAKDPSVREAFLQGHFTKEEPWNPLLKRN